MLEEDVNMFMANEIVDADIKPEDITFQRALGGQLQCR